MPDYASCNDSNLMSGTSIALSEVVTASVDEALVGRGGVKRGGIRCISISVPLCSRLCVYFEIVWALLMGSWSTISVSSTS